MIKDDLKIIYNKFALLILLHSCLLLRRCFEILSIVQSAIKK